MEIRDLFLKPSAKNPYDILKVQLIKHTASSEKLKLRQLINGDELGEKRPTLLLRHMKQLLGDKLGMSDDAMLFLCKLFLQHLPPIYEDGACFC